MLEAVVSDDVAGLPTSTEKWVRKSLRQIARELNRQSYSVGPSTVGRLLRKLKYGLVSNRKSLTGARHPDQDQQFRYIRRLKRLFLKAGLPVISVDAKNKELIGDFFNKGRTWRKEPDKVYAHDFRNDARAVAVPYGVYDLTHNQGYVYVGTSCDTAEFAGYCIAQWWSDPDRPGFACEDMLLILCDAGGSNNCRFWLWKQEVQQQLANQFGIAVMVCHYPTGNSKYNPIEYRLFSQISLNWAGQPLRSLQTMLNFVQGTTTKTGLTVRAFLVDLLFEKGRKVSKAAQKAINLERRSVCPIWNYIIRPQPLSSIPNP
jgi:hypothetical protein